MGGAGARATAAVSTRGATSVRATVSGFDIAVSVTMGGGAWAGSEIGVWPTAGTTGATVGAAGAAATGAGAAVAGGTSEAATTGRGGGGGLACAWGGDGGAGGVVVAGAGASLAVAFVYPGMDTTCSFTGI